VRARSQIPPQGSGDKYRSEDEGAEDELDDEDGKPGLLPGSKSLGSLTGLFERSTRGRDRGTVATMSTTAGEERGGFDSANNR